MSDMDVIRKLEKEVGGELEAVEIDRVNEIGPHRGYYSLNHNGRVVALNLIRANLARFPEVILDLTELRALHLTLNRLRELPEDIQRLIRLHELHLAGNYLKALPETLSELVNLRVLSIGLNGFSALPEGISRMANLEVLSIRNLDLRAWLEEGELPANLLFLDCRKNGLVSVPSSVSRLGKLRELFLPENKLSNIPLNLDNLKQLELLDLSESELRSIPLTIIGLTALRELILIRNNIERIPREIGNLKQLRSLNLRNNALVNLPDEIGELKSLRHLYLDGNRLAGDVPSAIYELTALELLTLQGNQIHSISDDISRLKSLEILQLSKNQLFRLPAALADLKQLEQLNCSENEITEISPALGSLELQWYANDNPLDGIVLGGNPLESPPMEVVEQGREAVLNYFRQLESQGVQRAFEAKILLVGEPGAGKTTLVRKLKNPETPVPDGKQKSTLGVEVEPGLEFQDPKSQQTIAANVWDFGGQDIQYMLHQNFLTADSLYVLVSDDRKSNTHYDYWFQVIQLLGTATSPLIVLLNKFNDHALTNFPRDHYLKEFKDMNIKVHELDLACNDARWTALCETMARGLAELAHVGRDIPSLWPKVRSAVEKVRAGGRNHISYGEYLAITREAGLESQADIRNMTGYYHNVGAFLYYEQEGLHQTVFLEPNWITRHLYEVLSNENMEARKGRFQKSWLFEFWQEQGLNQNECADLLQLMRKDRFALCYELPGGEGEYIVPLLLPDNPPALMPAGADDLRFRFQYPFMPAGIISRLIVQLHTLILEDQVWKKGMVLRDGECTCDILELKTRDEGIETISIRIAGGDVNGRRDALMRIRLEIEKVHRDIFPGIRHSEMFVCNCDLCTQAPDPHYFKREVLEGYMKKGRQEIVCEKSFEDVSIVHLLGAVYGDVDPWSRSNRKKSKHGEKYDRFYEQHFHNENNYYGNVVGSMRQDIRNRSGGVNIGSVRAEGNMVLADFIDRLENHENFQDQGVSRSDLDELREQMRRMIASAEAEQREQIENLVAALRDATPAEKPKIGERLRAMLLEHGVPILQNINAALLVAMMSRAGLF